MLYYNLQIRTICIGGNMKTYTENYIVDFRDVDRYYDIKCPQLLEILGTVSTKHTNEMGFDPFYLNRQGLAWILYEWKLDINFTRLYAETIRIESFAIDKKGMYFIRYFGIYDKNNKIIGRASAKWIVINTQKRKIVRLPKEMIDIFKPDISSMNEDQKWILDIGEDTIKAGNIYDDYIEQIFPIRFYDIDPNHHANNVKYVEWSIETLHSEEDFLKNHRIQKLNVVYKKETGEIGKILSKAKKVNNKTYHEIYSSDGHLLTLLEIEWVER